MKTLAKSADCGFEVFVCYLGLHSILMNRFFFLNKNINKITFCILINAIGNRDRAGFGVHKSQGVGVEWKWSGQLLVCIP